MSETIGNPLSWSVDTLRDAGHYLGSVTDSIRSEHPEAMPGIRRIDAGDIRIALRRGYEDFMACRSDVVFLCLLYPVIGATLAWLAIHRDFVQLVFPVMAGFALVGPAAAVGLYEMSRRREQGLDASWGDVLAIARSPSFGAIFALALLLGLVFLVWILAANGIYALTLGPEAPASPGAFLRDAVGTGRGWAMIVIGMGVGFLFAAAVLAASVVAFPLLLDRHVGLPVAVVTSLRVAAASPAAVATWGLIVAAGLVLGSIPVFLGLVVVLPILGHATWHLYRRAVVPPPGAPQPAA